MSIPSNDVSTSIENTQNSINNSDCKYYICEKCQNKPTIDYIDDRRLIVCSCGKIEEKTNDDLLFQLRHLFLHLWNGHFHHIVLNNYLMLDMLHLRKFLLVFLQYLLNSLYYLIDQQKLARFREYKPDNSSNQMNSNQTIFTNCKCQNCNKNVDSYCCVCEHLGC